MYGTRWINQHGLSDEGDVWLKGLVGIPPPRIAAGIRKLIESDAQYYREHGREAFLPSLAKFRALCLIDPQEVGAPPFDMAYHDAVDNAGIVGGAYRRWRHDAVHQAAIDLGFSTLRETEDDKILRDRFRVRYQDVIDRLAAGEVLPVTKEREERERSQKRLTQQPDTEARKKQRIKRGNDQLAKIRKSLGMGQKDETPSDAP